ncbi:MAG TPA: tRNA guanosine(34) transglycosylase Tgt [Acidimicrobiia bacterium]|jgi:queuine tRNA-ribosyltransferase|nr:tRNA guanosine(34) transglycosylase Tgt [Acidimicrobiia bacterium]
MPAVTWKSVAIDAAARTGVLATPHGEVRTPAFMPVGTRAAVKAVDTDDLLAVGAEIILANTYHLMLRPGAALIADLGGLHGFMSWEGPILTDSGGFQIFSLDPDIGEEGAVFTSIYDGARVELTPEAAVAIQEQLGPDIAMALDVCVGLPAPRERVETEMRRTLRWAERGIRAHRRSDQSLFGIVQGGVDLDLRAESARETAALGFDGFGIGGLSVGEPAHERNAALEAAVGELPDDKPRYVMGLGDTEGLLDAIARGADMFDCVIPTRLARHGRALSRHGDFNVNRVDFATDDRPIDSECRCLTCSRYSRAYLRHLVRMSELSAHRLLTIHNLAYVLDLVDGAAEAIEEGRFTDFVRDTRSTREGGSHSEMPDA